MRVELACRTPDIEPTVLLHRDDATPRMPGWFVL
ncbi:hypothetical protein V1286_003304 [Bradyrhizobium algeriense]|uniref:Uncharacterized protein n=1 Tax=Bradyrhizobium algeriense TaxID=634784 RepID=A0ABU8BB59_9BRAD